MKYFSIHGHFYQPPRQDPFTGHVPQEPGAAPYHDWNERIDAECYRPNARLGNFEIISFDLGPTLAAWLERHDPDTYGRIIQADGISLQRDGVGNALALPYNHVILPLASRRDKAVQVRWGIADFVHRFHRPPEGMWLPETAVDLETLEVLVENGIQFTVLAPWQADVDNVDTSEPYRMNLPSGNGITVLFFDAQLSKHISWTPHLTEDADTFARMSLPMRSNWHKEMTGREQICCAAMDGEVFGHHNRQRDAFLRQLLRSSAPGEGWTVTNLATHVHQVSPRRPIGLRENTAWSCYHGVARWRETCGCISADGSWKTHLRRALNLLAARLDDAFERVVGTMKMDPDRLLDEYIQVVLGKVDSATLIERHAHAPLSPTTVEHVTKLLQSQYYRQLMFTSCGFFFDELTGIEPRNLIACAARAIVLAREAGSETPDEEFLTELRRAVSVRTGRNGEGLYWEVLQNAGRSTNG